MWCQQTYSLQNLNQPKIKVMVDDTSYSASLTANPITKTLKYGKRFQGITRFYLPPTRLSTNGINQIVSCQPSISSRKFGYGNQMFCRSHFQPNDLGSVTNALVAATKHLKGVPAFACPAKDRPHLPTPEGWKAELA